tara:strand:- start:262 stop:426 length:165 start_codon:yes stop_codon:yes gene_type:complete
MKTKNISSLQHLIEAVSTTICLVLTGLFLLGFFTIVHHLITEGIPPGITFGIFG